MICMDRNLALCMLKVFWLRTILSKLRAFLLVLLKFIPFDDPKKNKRNNTGKDEVINCILRLDFCC